MMFTAAGSGNLDGLITLMEYVADPKKRAKELRELRDARDAAISSAKALGKAHDGAKKLLAADQVLEQAQAKANTLVAVAEANADEIVDAAIKKAGDLAGEKQRLAVLTASIARDHASFDTKTAAAEKELARRERRVTKREQNNAATQTDLTMKQNAMHEKAQRVEDALKG